MYPAAPNTNYKNIILGFDLIKNLSNKFIFPCTQKMNKTNQCTNFETITKIKKKIINNNLKDSGQFYFASTNTWLNSKKIIKLKSIIIPISKKNSVDINNYYDFKKAKKILINDK